MNKRITTILAYMLAFLRRRTLVFTVGNFKYSADNGSTNAILKGYITQPMGVLSIPSAVTHNGTNYSVVAIGNDAFYNCTGLTGTLTIPASITFIGEGAFAGCSGFTGALTIPESVTSIWESAFAGCSGFTEVLTIPESVTSIGNYAFINCSGFTGALTIPPSVTSIGEGAFINCRSFTGALSIPASVTAIWYSAFYNCYGLTHIEVDPNNPNYSTADGILYNKDQTLLHTCLYNKDGALFIPSSVTTIGNSAFYGCSKLTGALTIPESITNIGHYAFYNCSGFTETLTIPSSVTSIGYYAFYNCSNLTTVVNHQSTPLAIYSNTFSGIPASCILKVPIGSKAAYQAADVWKEFATIEEFAPSTSIENIEKEPIAE